MMCHKAIAGEHPFVRSKYRRKPAKPDHSGVGVKERGTNHSGCPTMIDLHKPFFAGLSVGFMIEEEQTANVV